MHQYLNGGNIRTWEKYELVLHAQNVYDNPYMDVDVWVDLKGPGYTQRVYGFWDGDNIFRIRMLGITEGVWRFVSGSNQQDNGLNGVEGEFHAKDWSEEEKLQNICRRGMLQATENGHGFQFPDGTPFYLLGDTWWSTPTFRYPWYDDNEERPIGPLMGFKDMVRFRKEQGFNSIAMIAAFPTWHNDGQPYHIVMDDDQKTSIRNAWPQEGTQSAKDMHNEGGRPFNFPGKLKGYEDIVPDFDRINPDYFKYMDRKVDYLNGEGFIPFIEVSRRDIGQLLKRYSNWPYSYTRYIQYIFARYQANICLLSPIHYDWISDTIPGKEYNEPANLVIEKYGHPPFGTLLGSNSNPSSLTNFGGPEEAKWLTFHQIGNSREHTFYWHLTEIYNAKPARPALNGEPYYPGYPNNNPPASSKEADFNFRSGLYGSFLSGGFAGYIYGAEGLWAGEIGEQAKIKMWEALKLESGKQVQYILKFMNYPDKAFQELIPCDELVVPNRAGEIKGYRGWAFAAATEERDNLLFYFEKECPKVLIRGLKPFEKYSGIWFNPITGEWIEDTRLQELVPWDFGVIDLPEFLSDQDWGLKLIKVK